MNIILNEEDFNTLISGGILHIKKRNHSICIGLMDIGFDKMINNINKFIKGDVKTHINRTKRLNT